MSDGASSTVTVSCPAEKWWVLSFSKGMENGGYKIEPETNKKLNGNWIYKTL